MPKTVAIIRCPCGKRLSARGAVPGRVGRCPACGAQFQVPGPKAAAARRAEVMPERAPVGPSAFVATADRGQDKARDRRSPRGGGLISPPERCETQLLVSLLYPFWGETGMALLLVLPPFLWLTSLPTISMVAVLLAEGLSDSTRLGVVFLTPIAAAFGLVLSFTLLYLGGVLVSSALGEVHHPRWPRWELHEMFRGLCRWFWAFVAGVGAGFVPAVAYWISCGDLDPLDLVVLVELLALGAVYAQMALLASLLHDDPLGANPITVVQGIIRIGWSYARPCLVSGVALALGVAAFGGIVQIKQPLLAALGLWAFWVLALYLAMVALRVLGLCYHRRCRELGWFRDRPRWGA
jgi:hypothetical protein